MKAVLVCSMTTSLLRPWARRRPASRQATSSEGQENRAASCHQVPGSRLNMKVTPRDGPVILGRQRRQLGGLHRPQGFPVEDPHPAVADQGDLRHGPVAGDVEMHGAGHHRALAEADLPRFPVPGDQSLDPGQIPGEGKIGIRVRRPTVR